MDAIYLMTEGNLAGRQVMRTSTFGSATCNLVRADGDDEPPGDDLPLHVPIGPALCRLLANGPLDLDSASTDFRTAVGRTNVQGDTGEQFSRAALSCGGRVEMHQSFI